ncbi:hypothetical protein L3Q82_011388 [Scortum barcoo]|uniref:Uncharacterized protein n=1 Tax=Scortum barcoo TaxID=214431 RepID=A0ACB8WA22_9TELE|nr:hypothetical protein L3Q82_011388 [Scortum barcoo]
MEADREVLLKLGRLAFEHLEKGNIMFYQEDLEQCGLDVTEASVYSGLCTEIFKRECVIFQKTVYCFVHLSIQEFLAAVYMFHCYTNSITEVLETFLGKGKKYKNSESSLDVFLKRALEKSLDSTNGHLDLFVRFLHGISLETNQRLLGGLLGQTDNSPEIIQRAINNLKEMNSDEISARQKHQHLPLSDGDERPLSVAYMLQMSGEVLDELDLKKLSGCGLSESHCEIVASALKSNPSHLRELDLRLRNCNLSEIGCASLVSALKSNPSHLRELAADFEPASCRVQIEGLQFVKDELLLSGLGSKVQPLPSERAGAETYNKLNELQDSGVKLLCGFLESPHCRLQTLRLSLCTLTEVSCSSLASALKSNPSHLRKLDLSNNNKLKESDVELLTALVESPNCALDNLSWEPRALSESE